MNFPTLYKINSRGKKQYWAISTDNNSYTVRHGQVDGKEQETTVKIKSGKNIGRSNATTVAEQAISEAQSKWNSQIDKGYGETVDKAIENKEDMIRPMLAHDYAKYPHKITFPCYGQPKLDGVRAIFVDGKLYSRKGKEFTSVPHIVEQLNIKAKEFPGVIFDGELYNHEDNFQDLISFIRRDEPSEATKAIQFPMYDCFIPHSIEPFSFRNQRLIEIGAWMFKETPHIFCVDSTEIKNESDVDKYHDNAIQHGYEGMMLRNAKAPYLMNRRSYDLLKVKSFMTEEFKIVGAEQNKGNQIDQCTVICETKDGAQFGAKPKGSAKEREKYWVDRKKNIGKMLTVKFFEWTTSENPVPRFPIGLGVRDYE